MKLIADSGSTTTEWCIIDGDKIHAAHTPGMNPFIINLKDIEKGIREQPLLGHYRGYIRELSFYGAGCGGEQNCQSVESTLQKLFAKAQISVYSDLLGAARSLFNKGKGMACILGTGSNSGFYDGKQIIRKSPALGYLLGDEGSGNHLGKKLLRSYLNNALPDDVKDQFERYYGNRPRQILHELYHSEKPNIYLSGFAKFMVANRDHEYIKKLVYEAMEAFIITLKNGYPASDFQYPVRCAGSIAWFFKDELFNQSSKAQIAIEKVVQTPMKGLIDFHSG